MQCSIDIQDELNEAQLAAGVVLNLKLGIGVGRTNIIHIGGMYGRYEYIACGPSLSQAFKCEGLANSGDIVISTEAWDMVKSKFEGKVINKDGVLVTKMLERIRNQSVRVQHRYVLHVCVFFLHTHTL